MVPGVLVFSLLYFSVPTTPHSTKVKENVNLKKAIKAVWYPLLILFLLVVIRSALQVCFVNFLPLYFSQKGATPTMAGRITTLFLFFGAIGGFCGGAIADRLGGKNVISWSMFFSTPLLLAFLLNGGNLSYVFLAAAGLTLLSTLPVNVVMAQDLMPQSSSVVSSLMMGLAWGTGGMVVPIIGIIADVAGLARALMAVSLLPILGFVLVQFLPTRYME
jgi:FSR family fosmidomycin resistance protein-like MFS transporter